MSVSPKWGAFILVLAFLYASREQFQITKHVQQMSEVGSGGKISDKYDHQLKTGFIQATNISIRPVAHDREQGTHVVTLAIRDLAPLASFVLPAATGVVHFMASTTKFFQVGINRPST